MNFIKERASFEKQIDELIKSREEVFNETLQDMLQAAIANYTGKDNSDGPTLPKTPSTCRRLRNKQQRKRKQQNDGSPQLTRTLRSNANKQKHSDATTNETVSTPLDNIGNKMDTNDQTIDTVRKSSRQCAVKATQAITQQTGRKKGSSNSKKHSDRVSDGRSQVPSASFSKEYHDEHVDINSLSLKKTSQGIVEVNSDDHTITDDSLNVSASPELQPPFLCCSLKNTKGNTQQQEVKDDASSPNVSEEVLSSPIVVDDEEFEVKCHDKDSTTHHDKTTTHYDELTTEQFFLPLVINSVHPIPSASTQVVSQSSCLNETRTISGPHEDAASDEDKYSTPPSDVSAVIEEECKPADGIRRITTVIKKVADTEKANQVIIHNGPRVNLASLTKLTPPLDSTPDASQTPATVMKGCLTKNYPTVIKGCPTSTPATITKESSNSRNGPDTNLADEQYDGSPELAVIRKPQGCPVGNSYPISGASKKQITPTNAFSPAKVKSTIPLEPSGLLHSNHAPPKAGLGGYKKLVNKQEQMQKAKEKLVEKNRRDKERLQQLEKKKEQERLEKKRRNQEQLRKVQERQALMLKKKEAQKMQVQQKVAATDLVSVEEVKIKATEKPLYEMPNYKDQGNKFKENFYSVTCESDEEHYWEEEKRKRDNCKDYKYHVQKEMEEADLEKKRMCSVDKIPAISEEGYTSTTGLLNLYSSDDGDYGLDDLNSDDSTDEEDDPRKPIPVWAQDDKLLPSIERQEERPLNASMAVFSGEANPVNLGRIFKTKKQRFFKRTSSAQWSSPPTKANNNDWIV